LTPLEVIVEEDSADTGVAVLNPWDPQSPA